MSNEVWEACCAFHGHQCPGIALGFKAVEGAAELLGIEAAPGAVHKGLSCVSTTAKCPVDAVRCLLGCTEARDTLELRPGEPLSFTFDLQVPDGQLRTVRLVEKPGALGGRSREEAIRFALNVPWGELYDAE